MPDLDKLFPGRFIKASEFNGKPWTVTIDHAVPEAIKSHVRGGKEETIAVAYLKETPRQWHMCKTNAKCVGAMFTRDFGTWGGHRVTLFPAPDTSGLSDSGLAIRVSGSPELTEPVVVKIKNPGRGEPDTRTLVPTGRTGSVSPPSTGPVPATRAPTSGPLTLRCTGCGVTLPASVDATADDLVGVCCNKCGADMAVAS